ncbi:MAG: phosphoenolpyruvate carboxylase [Balneolaceae bacterium]|nr:phosphoenolpyruvate carboxylase [Balneolaceae bacterium]
MAIPSVSPPATSIATANPDIMQSYADLVQDETVRDRMMDQILPEYERTRKMLEKIYGGPLSEKRSNVHHLLELRERPLYRLHHQQINLLKRWRNNSDDDNPELLRKLLLTVNAIASGLRTTG